jgi:uncharacterized protein with HEPN domain
MEKNDRERLGNMLEEARFAVKALGGRARADLDEDRQLTLSLLKSLELIASASSRISKECRLGCEPIPWGEIIDMKHQVVHTYYDIDRDWLWERVFVELPRWIEAMETLLSSD